MGSSKRSAFPLITRYIPHRLPLTTLREFTMLQIMNAVTDKPDWHVKVIHMPLMFVYFTFQETDSRQKDRRKMEG